MLEVWVRECRHFRGYEEVRTPAVKTAGMHAGERLLPIEEMEPWAQSAFKGFKYAASLPYHRPLHMGMHCSANHLLTCSLSIATGSDH